MGKPHVAAVALLSAGASHGSVDIRQWIGMPCSKTSPHDARSSELKGSRSVNPTATGKCIGMVIWGMCPTP